MKPAPSNFPRITPTLYYQDAAKAIDWLCAAFGFEVRLKIEGEGGLVEHSELAFGEGVIMVGDERRSRPEFAPWRSPRSVERANTQGQMVYVDDLAAHYERAKRAGAKITQEPSIHDYGDEYWSDRGYGAEDLDGHGWWFVERLRDPKQS